MDIATLRSMSVKELKNELNNKFRESFGLHQGLKSGEVKDIHKYHSAKKSVARIKTIISEKMKDNSTKAIKNK